MPRILTTKMNKQMCRNAISNKGFSVGPLLGIFMTLSSVILWNPWQMLAESLGSAEPRLKITAVLVVHYV